jgi:hypothetical protein
MKPFKTLVFAALLVLSIAFNTFAGDVDVPGAKPSPTPTLRVAITQDPSIEDPLLSSTTTQQTEVTSDTSDYLFYEALAALLSVY